MNNDYLSSPTPPRRSRRPLVVAGATAAAALAIGGGVAAAASADPSSSPSASPSASGSAAPKPPAERQHRPHLAGTVVSASGGTITITDREGFQRTIHTNGSTTYADGLTATPAAGTKIFAEGTVDADKTSLLATRIAKAPDRPEGRGPGGHGPGGPGRHGRPGGPDDQGPSSGTPSPGTPSPGSPSPGSPSPSASPTS